MEAARISSPGTGCSASEDGRWKSNEDRWKILHRLLSVKDRMTGNTIQGNGLCYVTESANLLGLKWCIQLPAYQQLKRSTTAAWWSKECKAAFNPAKEVLALDLLLTRFHFSLPIIVAADASDYGIGAVILHRMPYEMEKAICHASRSLTHAEKNYGQIEKEGLALIFANAAVEALPVTTSVIEEESLKDREISQVVRMIQTGKWPAKPSKHISNWKALSHSLSVQNGCLYFGHRIVVPASLQERILKQLYEGHPGMTKIKMFARGYVYWTNINRDIEETVRYCRNGQEAAKVPVKTILNSWAEETKRWEPIHTDYVGPLNGKMYLVIVDAYSKRPQVSVMSSSSTAATLRELRMLFARFGDPRVIVSDNRPQFTATEFQQFCIRQGIEHVRSPPFHTQSNGQAERFMDILKRTLQKIKEGRRDGGVAGGIFTVLPMKTHHVSTKKPSQAETFLGSQIRTSLTLLKEPTKETGTRNEKMEEQFNRHHEAQEKSYQLGEFVWVRDYRPKHEPVTKCLCRAVYDVLTEENHLWRRHANQMRANVEDYVSRQLYDDSD
ncbi:integrase core domain protein [Oesophagostomum dentatum]|uniref:RNA-directed DNA polymerase n=1 Tax=Oesophagostomum dentatum TaxID=61180 RepID=A0A0B1THS3_OESDE|nr:integrase core domain protein [Oesophagostomum dentatum]